MTVAEDFMDALNQLDRTGETEPMTALFREDAKLRRMAQSHTYEGAEEIEQFWRDYLSAFDEVRTEFHDTQAADGRIVLEWSSRGTLSDGTPFDYDGVSILEVDDGRVAAFRAYYDSAALVPPARPAR